MLWNQVARHWGQVELVNWKPTEGPQCRSDKEKQVYKQVLVEAGGWWPWNRMELKGRIWDYFIQTKSWKPKIFKERNRHLGEGGIKGRLEGWQNWKAAVAEPRETQERTAGKADTSDHWDQMETPLGLSSCKAASDFRTALSRNKEAWYTSLCWFTAKENRFRASIISSSLILFL